MSIIRIKKKEHPYVQVDKRVLEDSRLSWRAKGILVYLLTKPDGWTVKVADIWGKGQEGRGAVQACLKELNKYGYAQLVTTKGDGTTFAGKEWQVNEEPIGGFLASTDKPKADAPINRKSVSRAVNSNNESLSEINSNNEGERNTPAPNPSNLQSQKKESGLVAPAENPETVKAETPPLPKVAPKGIPPIEKALSEFYQNGMYNENGYFEVTAIASPTDLPGVTLIEAAPPLKRAENIMDAEKKIVAWMQADSFETVKYRHQTAKRRFDPDSIWELAAHYCSVYASTNEGSRASLLRDPVAHFESGLFKYLTMQNTIDRNNAPKEGGATRQTTNGKANLNQWGRDASAYAEPQKF